jgi:hypothetical protein
MVWDGRKDRWHEGIVAAKAYRDAHGHLRVPQGFIADDGFRLGHWISLRRADRARGSLSAERVAQLDALGMVWDPIEEDWQKGMTAAREYREAHGHLRVPRAFVSNNGFRLGTWINNRRRERRRDKLSADRVAQLDALEMVWDPRQERSHEALPQSQS